MISTKPHFIQINSATLINLAYISSVTTERQYGGKYKINYFRADGNSFYSQVVETREEAEEILRKLTL